VNPQNIPAELKGCNNWVVWKTEGRDGNPTKPLYDANRNGKHAYAKVNDAATWASFNRAAEVSDILLGDYEGAGFVFTDTDYVGVDLDGVVHEDKTIDPFAVEIVKIANTYCEFSPSGTGVHLIFESSLPLPAGNRKGSKKLGGEIYNKTSPRYFTVTGDKVKDLSSDDITKIDDPEKIALLHFMVLHLHDTKLTRLWMGDTSAYNNDDSKADFALLSELAKLTQNNPVKMEKFFSASALGRRDKWIDRADYRQRTIGAALDTQAKESTNIQPSSRELVFHLPAVEGTHRDYVVAPAAGQKDGWFPCGSVSLIAGSSGGTKTTLMLQLLMAQAIKASFYGHQTYGRSFLMIGADRGEDAHKRTMERMNLNIANVPFKPIPTVKLDFDAVQSVLDAIESVSPLPEIVFVEGVDMMVSENNAKKVPPFVHELSKIAQHYHIAIIGSTGAPKVQEGKAFAGARENVIGSTTWGRTVETIMLMQFPKGDDTSLKRKLTVMLRNAPAEKFFLKIQDGLLEPDPDAREENAEEEVSEQESREIDWYRTQARLAKTNPAKTWFTIMDMERALHLKHSTADYHVKNHRTKGYLKQKSGKRGGRGSAAEYCWNESKTNPLWTEQQAQEAAEQMDVF
jgi:primase/DNA polymerase family protein/AAA domain-containing protein